jgi:peptidoglycan/LPS O-acetylase OafA/YrhL
MVKRAMEVKGIIKRIELLDSFRFIAITIVILFHYFSAKAELNIYPYGKKYSDLFRFGDVGVQLFFIISGFVIYMTIENCSTFKEFFLKRLIRLWPALTLSSVISFIGIYFLDMNNEFPELKRGPEGFLPSLTFVDPLVWSHLLHKHVQYIDNVHWSLLVEIKFYVIFGILFL